MPGPIVSLIGNSSGGPVSMIAGTLFNMAAAPALEQQQAERTARTFAITMNSWYASPIIPPPPDALFNLYNRGFIDTQLFETVLRNQGIGLGAEPADSRARNHQRAWRAFQNASKERPSVSFILSMWSRGYWEETSPEAVTAINRAGGHGESWQRYISALYETPPVSVLIEGKLRNLLNAEQLDEGMKRLGYGHASYRNLYRGLMKVNPSASDWVHFSVKEALSPDVANPVRLYDEFPQQISQYLAWQGLDWELDFDIIADGVRRRARIPDLYWASHWQPISPSQAYGMYHLLRAGRLERYRLRGLNVSEFKLEDVERWLRINDYPAGVRDNLLALSFTPLRLVDIRTAIALNYRMNNDPQFKAAIPQEMQRRIDGFNRQWAIAQFMDRGVLEDDAGVQVDIVIGSLVWQQQAPLRAIERSTNRRNVNFVLKGYALGSIPREQASNFLQAQGLSAATADALLDPTDAAEDITTAKAIIDAVKRGYLHGVLTSQEARSNLATGGITQERIDAYIERWDTLFTYDRIQLTTAKIVRYTGQGLMTVADARDRLTRLGWKEADTVLLLAEAGAANLRLQGQAIRAADNARAKRARELERALRQAQKNTEAIQAAIRRQTPITFLQRLVRKGRITRAQFINRAIRAGYSQAVAQKYLEDALTPEPPKPKSSGESQPRATPQQQQQSLQSESPESATPEPVQTQPLQPQVGGTQVERPQTTVTRPETALPPVGSRPEGTV